MLDPSQSEAAKAAYRAAYRGGDRKVDRIIPVQGDYAFNESAGVVPRTGPGDGGERHPPQHGEDVYEIYIRFQFGLKEIERDTEARQIMSDLDVPQVAVVFKKRKLKLFAN